MDISDVNRRGLVLLGCGKMGFAMLQGWLAAGVSPESVWVLDPFPSEAVKAQKGLHLNAPLPDAPAAVVIAVKPQMMGDALPVLASLGNGDTLFISIAAGTRIETFESVLGAQTPILRAMPNTPAAIGKGITALIGNKVVDEGAMQLGEALLGAIGQTVRLQEEGQMDAVTAVSGSGPAYVFYMIECLAAAGQAEGLPPELAMQLARATVAGAGALAEQSADDPAQLRINVTSPAGTTEAGLRILMDDEKGLQPLIRETVRAAAERSKELSE